MNPDILYSVKAQRGPTLRCKGWKQESLLRMLENNMENAEAPERLVIYGGIGKCARNWESYHVIVKSLKELENDETLVIQSGMPGAIFKTQRLALRVIMANTNIRPNGPAHLGRSTTAACASIRKHVDFLEHDRDTTPDILALAKLIKSGELLEATDSALEGTFE